MTDMSITISSLSIFSEATERERRGFESDIECMETRSIFDSNLTDFFVEENNCVIHNKYFSTLIITIF